VRPDPAESRQRLALLCLLAGAAVAAVSLPLAAGGGVPYLSLDQLSPWLVSFAIGLFGALFALPFAIHGRIGGPLEGDARWERSLLWWGAIAVAVFCLGLLLGLPSGFASDSLAGSTGLVIAVEAGLVLATLLVWLISG
jgi:hypothetical protein